MSPGRTFLKKAAEYLKQGELVLAERSVHAYWTVQKSGRQDDEARKLERKIDEAKMEETRKRRRDIMLGLRTPGGFW